MVTCEGSAGAQGEVMHAAPSWRQAVRAGRRAAPSWQQAARALTGWCGCATMSGPQHFRLGRVLGVPRAGSEDLRVAARLLL